MSYKYTDYGAAYPSQGGYHDNSGYYGSGKNLSKKGSQQLEPVSGGFEPIRTYPSQVTRVKKDRYNWHMLRTAVVAMICCPVVCGLFGLVYALLSYVDFHHGDLRKYHAKKNCSLGWSITGIILGSLSVLAAIVAGIVLAIMFGYALNLNFLSGAAAL